MQIASVITVSDNKIRKLSEPNPPSPVPLEVTQHSARTSHIGCSDIIHLWSWSNLHVVGQYHHVWSGKSVKLYYRRVWRHL